MASRQAFSPPRPASRAARSISWATRRPGTSRIGYSSSMTSLSGLRERTECHVSTDPTATQSGDDSRDVLPARGAFDALAFGLTEHHLFDSGESAPDIQSTNKVRAASDEGGVTQPNRKSPPQPDRMRSTTLAASNLNLWF